MNALILDIEGRPVSIGDKVYFTVFGSEVIVKGTLLKETPKYAILVGDGDYYFWKAQIEKSLVHKSKRVIKI